MMVPVLRISKESERYDLWMDMFGADCVPVTTSAPVFTNLKGGPAKLYNSEIFVFGPEWGLCYKLDILGLSPEHRSILLSNVSSFLGQQECEIAGTVWGSSGIDIVDGPDLTMSYESQFAI